jgi:regulator of chromosome condensation
MSDVWVFGSGDCGQLAIDEDTWSVERPMKHPYFCGKDICQVSAGGLHTLALDRFGSVHSWGCNDEKALGHQAEEFSVGKVTTGLEQEKVIQVAAGDSISAALTADGRVFTWGTFRDSKGLLGHSHRNHFSSSQRSNSKSPIEPSEQELLQPFPTIINGLSNIRSISAGSNHLFAINAEGELFSWGCGEQGQLGRRVLERHKHLGLRPTLVTPREGRHHIPIARVCAGAYHTLLLSGNGHLYVMGHNNYGQLGTGDLEPQFNAIHVDFPEPVVEMAAGEHHSLILTASGRVFASGRNDAGELGIPSLPTHTTTFTQIDILGDNVRHISAGGHHSLAVTKDGSVYSWGYGEMHQLGLGHDQIVKTPALLDLGLSKVGLKDVRVTCGAQHTVLLTFQ